MKNSFIVVLLLGLMFTSCDYFETNNDNTYPNTTGDIKLFNQTSVDFNFKLTNPEDVTNSNVLAQNNATEYFQTPVGFKRVLLTNPTTNDTIFNAVTKTGIHAGRKHSLFFASRTERLAADGDLPARDTVIVTMALLDNYASFDAERIKLRVVNTNKASDKATVFVKVGSIDPLTDAPTFSAVGFAAFDISYANMDAGNYSILVLREDDTTIAISETLEKGNGYTLLIGADGNLSMIKDN